MAWFISQIGPPRRSPDGTNNGSSPFFFLVLGEGTKNLGDDGKEFLPSAPPRTGSDAAHGLAVGPTSPRFPPPSFPPKPLVVPPANPPPFFGPSCIASQKREEKEGQHRQLLRARRANDHSCVGRAFEAQLRRGGVIFGGLSETVVGLRSLQACLWPSLRASLAPGVRRLLELREKVYKDHV